MTFANLNLDNSLLQVLEESNFHTPTPIQIKAIPFILSNKDVLACAQTGTGKTATYVLPILHNLINNKNSSKSTQCVIIAPTRELVLQISETITTYSKYIKIKHVNIFGGQNPNLQTRKLGAKPEIIIATPGRLLDFLNQKIIKLHDVKHLVLDEADQMLDMGFIRDIKRILTYFPKKKQTMLLSATMPSEIESFAKTLLDNPEKVSVEKVSTPVKLVQQEVIFANAKDKVKFLHEEISKRVEDRCIVFVRTKHGADNLVKKLSKLGIEAQAIHGNKSLNKRINTLESFKKDELKVLIATDIAARGIDIAELPMVINFELPQVPETYVHRIGRTGRAGKTGIAISFCSPEENKELAGIQKLIGFKIPSRLN